MKGAKEYAELFETGQYGRLYIVSGRHARGRTFHIQILPENEKAITNGIGNTCLNSDAVQVYGVISGNPGWTESYGWLHEGKWQDDFNALVLARKKEIADADEEHSAILKNKTGEEARRIKTLLESY